jgi:hypothetical protein
LNVFVRFVRVIRFADVIECHRVICTGFDDARAAAPSGNEGSEILEELEDEPGEQAESTAPDAPSRTRPPRKSLRFSRRSPSGRVREMSIFVPSLLVRAVLVFPAHRAARLRLEGIRAPVRWGGR